MHDGDNLRLVGADEQNVTSVLPHGDRAHVSTFERMAVPEFQRKLSFEVRGIRARRHPMR